VHKRALVGFGAVREELAQLFRLLGHLYCCVTLWRGGGKWINFN